MWHVVDGRRCHEIRGENIVTTSAKLCSTDSTSRTVPSEANHAEHGRGGVCVGVWGGGDS